MTMASADQALRQGETVCFFGEESAEGIACADLRSEFRMKLDAGVGGDRIADLGAARAKMLDHPADGGGVHGKEETGAGGAHHTLLSRLVGEGGEVAALKGNHRLETTQGGAIFEKAFGARAALLRSVADASEEEHPAGKNQGKFAQVFAVLVTFSAEKREGLEDLD